MNKEYADAWLSDDGNRRKLSMIINDPTYQAALSIIKERGRPSTRLITSPASDALTTNAMEHARLTGFHEALDQLHNLVNKPTNNETHPVPEPFMEEAIEELRVRGLDPKNR